MYFDTHIEYQYQVNMEFIEKEMHNIKCQALKKLASIVVHFNIEIANILAYSWFDSLPDAEKIANELDLCKLDFLAIQEDLEAFKEEYLNDAMLRQNYYDTILCQNF